MHTMVLVPDADGYQSTDGTEWISTKLDGGRGRYRRDKIGASKSVQVKWTLNPAQYQYWRAFYAVVGSAAFQCYLVSEDGTGPKLHTCNIIPGSVVLPSQQGFMYVQQAQLEVTPLPRDSGFDEALVMLYESTGGGDIDGWFDALERLALVTIPADF